MKPRISNVVEEGLKDLLNRMQSPEGRGVVSSVLDSVVENRYGEKFCCQERLAFIGGCWYCGVCGTKYRSIGSRLIEIYNP